jgi:hypothetical protein
MCCGSLGYLIVWHGLYRVDQIRKEDGVLDEENGDVVANDIWEVLAMNADGRRGIIYRNSPAVSTLPLSPATVDIRTNIGVSLPAAERNDAAVMSDQSA